MNHLFPRIRVVLPRRHVLKHMPPVKYINYVMIYIFTPLPIALRTSEATVRDRRMYTDFKAILRKVRTLLL